MSLKASKALLAAVSWRLMEFTAASTLAPSLTPTSTSVPLTEKAVLPSEPAWVTWAPKMFASPAPPTVMLPSTSSMVVICSLPPAFSALMTPLVSASSRIAALILSIASCSVPSVVSRVTDTLLATLSLPVKVMSSACGASGAA
ncbi:MAG: hypothetical protein M5U07_10860 [Xanthobacteraceae bacterium]|nr:hypothetical protein [Xanthobacteraceae bacterium]